MGLLIYKVSLVSVDILVGLNNHTDIHVDVSCVWGIDIARNGLITIIIFRGECFGKDVSGFERLLFSNSDIDTIGTLEIQFDSAKCSDSKADDDIFAWL